MERVNRRDVILAELFYSDLPESKMRPCIVLSREKYNSGGFVLVAPVTTAGDDYCIPISEKDVDCNLYEGSGVRFDGLARIRNGKISHKIGRASSEFCAKLVERICGMMK
jgi:mRNA-degrading endonuclease toxin of MazEF toxin-antitoxin module